MSRIDHLRHRTVELAQLAALGLAVVAAPVCAQNEAKPDAKPGAAAQPGAAGPLQTKLDAKNAEFAKAADPEMIKAFNQAVENLTNSGILDEAKGVGETAPDFELTDATGKTVALAELLAEGPVVLTFYRGGWCPYCNIQLRAYQEQLEAFTALGANLVAISPELPDNSMDTVEKSELKFDVLSDPGNEVADAFGLRYEIDPLLAERFAPMLEAQNGDDSHTLPLTATYVIDQKGTIRYALVTADYKVRAEPSELLASLKHVKMGH